MSINNFETIEEFMQFEPGTFYKFELLVRNTDGANKLYQEGYSGTNKNILVKSWYVDNEDYYKRIKNEMINLADLTGARVYMTLDRKDNVKLVQSLIHEFTDTLCAMLNGQAPAIKSISKTFASETSKERNSSKQTRTLMWDVDIKDETILNAVLFYITEYGKQVPYVLNTKKGYHVFCFRKFDHKNWETMVLGRLRMIYTDQLTEEKNLNINDDFGAGYEVHAVVESKLAQVKPLLSVKSNELGLVYHPMKGL